jgi:hypothetical protein
MRHESVVSTCLRAAAACVLAVAAACDTPSGPIVPGGGSGRAVQEVLVTPEGRTVQAGATLQFAAAGVMSDGDTADSCVKNAAARRERLISAWLDPS